MVNQTLLGLLFAGFLTIAGAQELPPPSVEVFAQLESMKNPRLSPDGTQIAFLSAIDGRYHLVIERFYPEFSRRMVLPGQQLEFKWVRWASDDRLVLSAGWSARRDANMWGRGVNSVRLEETRLFSVNADGGDLQYIIKPGTFKETGSHIRSELPPPSIQDDVVHWLPDEPDHILVAVDSDFDGYEEIRKIDITDGSYKTVMDDFSGPVWVADQDGELRIGYGFSSKDEDIRIHYRTIEGDWKNLSEKAWVTTEFEPLAFTADPAVALAMGPNEHGLWVVRELNLETGEFGATVFEHEWADAASIELDDVTGKPIGINYTEHLPRIHYFDATMKGLQRSVDAAMPGMTNVIASTSRDQRRVLIFSSDDAGLGSYYLWDRDARSLDFYAHKFKGLNEVALAPTEAVSYEARDGLQIPAYLTVPLNMEAKNLPAVMLPHGGPHSRSDKSYWFIAQYLAAKGYLVLQPNFRGSSGYGLRFENSGNGQWGGKMQEDVSDGAEWLVERGMADPERMCIVGWSYGGYVAAMGAAQTPDLYQCSASINGVLHLPRQMDHNNQYIGGWLWNRDIGLEGEKVRTVSPYHLAENIKVPMLIIQSEDDARVLHAQGRTMSKRLEDLGKDVTYVELESGGHQLRNVPARERILELLDEFLGDHIGQ